jgi:hypothetical protein
MADLLDIAPSTAVQSVKIDGRFITVRGLHGEAIASIVSRFPQLASVLSGGGVEFGPKLIAHFGNAIAPIIAAGCGHHNDEKTKEYEQVAGNLLVEDQLKLVAAIIGLTFPNGMASFVKSMTAFLVGTDEREKPVKMRLKQSPSVSQPSSAEDSPQTMQ